MRVLRRDSDRRPDDADTVETDTPAADRPTTTPTTTTRESEVVVEQWSVADAIVAVIGAGFAVVGALVLIRTGIDGSWFRPVEEVADVRHTPLLGAIELGGGVLLMLAAAPAAGPSPPSAASASPWPVPWPPSRTTRSYGSWRSKSAGPGSSPAPGSWS